MYRIICCVKWLFHSWKIRFKVFGHRNVKVWFRRLNSCRSFTHIGFILSASEGWRHCFHLLKAFDLYFYWFEIHIMHLLLYEKCFFIWKILLCVVITNDCFNVCMCLHEWHISPVKGSWILSLLVIWLLFLESQVLTFSEGVFCALLHIEVQLENKF